MANYNKELYYFYKEKHICVSCGHNNAAPGRVRCEECLAKNAERKQKNMDPVVQKANREKRKAQGKCINCGKPISPYSKCFCVDCRIKNQRRNNKRKDGIDRSERPSYGMCYICGNEIVSGKLCESCKSKCINNLPESSHESEWYLNHKRSNRLIFN